ncbi:MAG: hypothetical protein JW901_10290 [Dehalococcoidia bacterium]|nr:hypothetical protein [Dehalococcoidia bacterium]
MKVLFAVILVFLPLLAGCAAPLSGAVLCTQTDASGRPLNAADSFTIDMPAIICAVPVDGLRAASQVRAEWLYYEPAGWQSIDDQSGTVAVNTYLAFTTSAPASGWQPGDYLVRLYLDGALRSEKGFSIRPEEGKAAPVINTFQATPSTVSAGQQLSLTWNVSGASRIVISPGIGEVDAGGSRLLSPGQDTTYTLTALNSGGTTTGALSVTVSAEPEQENSDLAVLNIFREASIIYYTVANLGPGASQGCDAGLYATGPLLATSYVPPLQPGERRTLYFARYSWSHPLDTPATVCVDIDGQNNETPGGNNCLIMIIFGQRGI